MIKFSLGTIAKGEFTMNHEKQKQAEALAIEALRIISKLVGIYASADAEIEFLKKIPKTALSVFRNYFHRQRRSRKTTTLLR